MSAANLIKFGKIAGAVLTGLALLTATRPLIISDAPPWASKATVTQSEMTVQRQIESRASMILARLVVGNMLAMQTRYCEAVASQHTDYARSLAATISMLQEEYRGYMGYDYNLPGCV